MINETDYWCYEVKCRKCNKKTRMFFSMIDQTKKEDFRSWIYEHATFPIHKQCSCDNGDMMLHDIISYSISAA